MSGEARSEEAEQRQSHAQKQKQKQKREKRNSQQEDRKKPKPNLYFVPRRALYISNHLKDIHFKKLPFLLFEFGTKEKKKKDKETPHAFFSRLSSLTWHLAGSFFSLSLSLIINPPLHISLSSL